MNIALVGVYIFCNFLLGRVYAGRNCSLVGSLAIENPAYTSVVKNEKTGRNVLYVSSFSGEQGDHGKLFVIPDLSSHLFASNFSQLKIYEAASDSQYVWPNTNFECKSATCGRQGIFNSNGFLIPGRNTGNAFFLPIDEELGKKSKAYPLFQEEDSYFYHQTRTYDLFGDGKEEIISARVKVDLQTLEGTGEMIVTEGPLFSGQAKEEFDQPRILFKFDGPETVFDIVKDSQTHEHHIIAPQFFSSQLVLYSSDDWKSAKYETKIIDEGGAFDAKILDMNCDGNLDIICSMQWLGHWGYLYAYHKVGETWERHLLSGPFTHAHGMSNGAPGMIGTIDFDRKNKCVKPSFILGGDDGGSFFLVNPKNEVDVDNWEYETQVLFETKETVAQVEVFYEGENVPYLLLNDYSQSKILLFSCRM